MQKTALLISVLSLCSALFFNQINFQKLQNEYPTEFYGRYTVGTADDASYLVPPVNFLNGKGWRSNDVGSGAYVFRTPGYGCFFLINLLFAGNHALFLLRNIQLLLFACSVYLLFLSVFKLTQNKLLAVTFSIIYGILPFTQGFLYYTLTEGITPFLVILFSYLIICAYKNINIKQFYFAAFTLSVLIIIRPQMLILSFAFLPFLFSLIKTKQLKNITIALSIVMICVSLLTAWQIKNYLISQRWVPLNAVYNPDNNSIFRPQHLAITAFYQSFGANGTLFHSSVNQIWQHAIMGDTSAIYIEQVMKHIPGTIIECVGKEQVAQAFKLYQTCSFEQKDFIQQKLPMPVNEIKSESQCVAAFNKLTSDVHNNCFLYSRIYVPIKTYFKLSLHSNLSLHIFQHDWRGKWWMELLRWICALIHVSLFAFFFLQLFFKKDALSFLLFFVPMIYLFYLCFITIIVEERYTLPLLPILVLGITRVIDAFSRSTTYMSFSRKLF